MILVKWWPDLILRKWFATFVVVYLLEKILPIIKKEFRPFL